MGNDPMPARSSEHATFVVERTAELLDQLDALLQGDAATAIARDRLS
jgi:hypothetical protein